MAGAENLAVQTSSEQDLARDVPSAFEHLITAKPPVLESLIAQLPTESILALYHTSSYLNHFLKNSPTSWRYISMRLHQPAPQSVTPTNNAATPGARQSSNYALDQLLLYVISPFSTRLISLELDNTAVSGATLFQTVMVLRKDTLEHVSVRGCKNVSLKYHINHWLTMHAMALDRPKGERAPGYEKLALKSLYTYRCRHHRRRPYLPSSLTRKESDSEPTHELVLTCHKLGIWTDTAWCTTPGARCFRRRGYVTMRVPQDPREVWVVFDRLWRSRNWLGPIPETRQSSTTTAQPSRKRKRDCRSWEVDEEAMNGEPVGVTGEGKDVPAHLRRTHRQFVDDIYCDNCSDPILERCEQCSVMMHCSGCRKTLCASCAFDRPYLRNKNAPEDERNKLWWAPGCAVSPCSMSDQDAPPPGPAGNIAPATPPNPTPSIKFKWCCTEPVFSGGGGITFGSGSNRDTDRIRAAPLKMGHGWEDPEFSSHHDLCCDASIHEAVSDQIGTPLSRADAVHGSVGGRWPSIDALFQADSCFASDESPASVPRILCDECFGSEQWKIKCKACTLPLCLRHDVKDRMRVRICGYKDLVVEKAEYKSRQKALRLLTLIMLKRRKGKLKAADDKVIAEKEMALKELIAQNPGRLPEILESPDDENDRGGLETPRPTRATVAQAMLRANNLEEVLNNHPAVLAETDDLGRPTSPGSNSTGPPSRSSSPTPSARSSPATPEPNNTPRRPNRPDTSHPLWKGCQSFFCPPNRTPGDHRRRCVANMRQCAECKIHVCELCVSGLPPPCPCRGCKPPSEGESSATAAESASAENLRFFCPNCRWTRRKTGKCKKRIVEIESKRSRRREVQRHRKPIEQRQSRLRSTSLSRSEPADDAIFDQLAEFMQSISVAEDADENPLEEQPTSSNNVSLRAVTAANTLRKTDSDEIRKMNELAMVLLRRMATLQQQFRPEAITTPNLSGMGLQDPSLQLALHAQMLSEGRNLATPSALEIAALASAHIEVDEEFMPESSRARGVVQDDVDADEVGDVSEDVVESPAGRHHDST